MNPRYILSLLMILATCEVFSQVQIINVSLKQPRKLEVNAGEDILVENPESISVGEDVTVTGGNPEYLYSWKDEMGNNFESKIITVSSFGSYYLTVTDVNNCSAIDSLKIINSVGISRQGDGSSLILYPNPASGIVFIPLETPGTQMRSEGELVLQIISFSGKVIYSKKIDISDPGKYYELNTGNISQGIYNIVLENKDSRKVYKIVLE
jgi:hypothetical protein